MSAQLSLVSQWLRDALDRKKRERPPAPEEQRSDSIKFAPGVSEEDRQLVRSHVDCRTPDGAQIENVLKVFGGHVESVE